MSPAGELVHRGGPLIVYENGSRMNALLPRPARDKRAAGSLRSGGCLADVQIINASDSQDCATEGEKATAGRAFGDGTDPLRSRLGLRQCLLEDSRHEENSLGNGRSRGARRGARRGPAIGEDRVCEHVQRPDRRDRQRHAQFVRAGARSSRPQDGRLAGRGDLRGRPAEAGGRQAEDREADPVRQGQFRRRLYLVERAARIAQAGGRIRRLS